VSGFRAKGACAHLTLGHSSSLPGPFQGAIISHTLLSVMLRPGARNGRSRPLWNDSLNDIVLMAGVNHGFGREKNEKGTP
jgi:hypothetical protein